MYQICVRIYMYIYVYVHIYRYIYIHTRTHSHTHLLEYLAPNFLTSFYVYIYLYTYTYSHTYTYTHSHTYIYSYHIPRPQFSLLLRQSPNPRHRRFINPRESCGRKVHILRNSQRIEFLRMHFRYGARVGLALPQPRHLQKLRGARGGKTILCQQFSQQISSDSTPVPSAQYISAILNLQHELTFTHTQCRGDFCE